MKHSVVRLLCVLIALQALVTTSAWADLGYTVTTTVERADGLKRYGEKVLTIGDKARIDFLGSDGTPEGGYVVTTDGGKSFALTNGSQAYCSNWTLSEFFQAAGRFLEKGKRLANADLSEVSVEKVLEEPGGRIEGFETTHIRVVTRYGAKARILLLTMEYTVEEIDDIWMTSELDLPVFERLWLQTTSQSGFDYLDEISARRIAFETGPVLRLENVVTLRNLKKGEEKVKKEITVVHNLREITADDIPKGHFDMPPCEPVSRKEMEKNATRMLKKHVR